MERGNCRSCNQPIIWAKTVAGHVMPLDAEPSEKGNMVIKDGVAVVVHKDELFSGVAEGPFYASHFASCPQAAHHRKKK